jgi:hypothetical protein
VSRDHRDDVIDVGERGIEFEFDLMDDAAMAVMRMKLMIVILRGISIFFPTYLVISMKRLTVYFICFIGLKDASY